MGSPSEKKARGGMRQARLLSPTQLVRGPRLPLEFSFVGDDGSARTMQVRHTHSIIGIGASKNNLRSFLRCLRTLQLTGDACLSLEVVNGGIQSVGWEPGGQRVARVTIPQCSLEFIRRGKGSTLDFASKSLFEANIRRIASCNLTDAVVYLIGDCDSQHTFIVCCRHSEGMHSVVCAKRESPVSLGDCEESFHHERAGIRVNGSVFSGLLSHDPGDAENIIRLDNTRIIRFTVAGHEMRLTVVTKAFSRESSCVCVHDTIEPLCADVSLDLFQQSIRREDHKNTYTLWLPTQGEDSVCLEFRNCLGGVSTIAFRVLSGE